MEWKFSFWWLLLILIHFLFLDGRLNRVASIQYLLNFELLFQNICLVLWHLRYGCLSWLLFSIRLYFLTLLNILYVLVTKLSYLFRLLSNFLVCSLFLDWLLRIHLLGLRWHLESALLFNVCFIFWVLVLVLFCCKLLLHLDFWIDNQIYISILMHFQLLFGFLFDLLQMWLQRWILIDSSSCLRHSYAWLLDNHTLWLLRLLDILIGGSVGYRYLQLVELLELILNLLFHKILIGELLLVWDSLFH